MSRPDPNFAINSPNWCRVVTHRLREGWGVEDIAVEMSTPIEAVREQVARLRRHGMLNEWWRK